jgi:hypothetical protein
MSDQQPYQPYPEDVSAGNSTVLSLVAAIINVVVGVAALVYLYRPDSSAYFNARSGR